jgi:hypothetical protein
MNGETLRQLQAYLGALLGPGAGGLLEVRFRRAADGMGQCFFDAGHTAHASRVILGLGQRTDVYVGAAPRTAANGRRSAIDVAWVVWADCDTEESTRRLSSAVPQPSIIVRSGSQHGSHAYWLLDSPLPIGVVEVVNRRIALAIGADGRSADGARILRPPGTMNFKRSQPAPVTLERLDAGARHAAAHLAARLPTLPSPPAAPGKSRRDSHDPLRAVAPVTYVRVLLGVEVGRSRKIRCPFHDDRTPSLHVYETPEQGWYCFGCGRGTSIYDMAAAAWGLGTRGREFLEVQRRLRLLFGFEWG